MSERNTRIRASQLRSILPSDVEATNSASDTQIPSKATGQDKFTWMDSNEAEATTKDINQSSHGFSVGDVLRWEGASGGVDYAKAKADTDANAEVIGIVVAVIDNNNFTLLTNGYISGLSSLTAGTVYYLSASTAGALTSTEPTTSGYISKPILIAISSTEGFFFNMRGVEITTNLYAYRLAFDNGDLSSGILTVTHNLDQDYVLVQVYNNNKKVIIPDEIESKTSNSIEIDLSSYGAITGTWNVVVMS